MESKCFRCGGSSGSRSIESKPVSLIKLYRTQVSADTVRLLFSSYAIGGKRIQLTCPTYHHMAVNTLKAEWYVAYEA